MVSFPFGCAIVSLAASVACAQWAADDAGDVWNSSASLQIGANVCRFDARTPRAFDTDYWRLPTEPGFLYSLRARPLDDMLESLLAQPSAPPPMSSSTAPFAVDFNGTITWTRGDGEPLYLVFQGLARRDGNPTRYRIEIDRVADPGDPEGDSPTSTAQSSPVALSDGIWYTGSFSPYRPSRPPQSPTNEWWNVQPDRDVFTFPFIDRGVYLIEYTGPAHGIYSEPISTVSIIADATGSATAIHGYTPENNRKMVEFRGSGTASFTLTGAAVDTTSQPYAVRVRRIAISPPGDHGNAPELATVLVPGAPALRGNGYTYFNGSGLSSSFQDIDWFAVPAIAGHLYDVRVFLGGLRANRDLDIEFIAEPGASSVTRLSQVYLPYQFTHDSTGLIATARFRGREGPPVRLGLFVKGTYTIIARDLGPVNDDHGDPFTGARVISMTSPSVSGVLNGPHDVDSFSIEPPALPGQYRLSWSSSLAAGFTSGISVIQRLSYGSLSRVPHFAPQVGSLTLTRTSDGSTDSFPVRVDFLSIPSSQAPDLPATGPNVPYTLTLTYIGPNPIVEPPAPTPDDAPSGIEGAPIVALGQYRTFLKQSPEDVSDTALVELLAGRLYAASSDTDSGVLSTLDGRSIPGDIRDTSGNRFYVVSQSGLYSLRQVYRTGPLVNIFRMYAGFTDYGEVHDDRPNDAAPERLLPGVTTGTLDFEGDRDRFYLPYDEGGVYRITLTSDAPANLTFGEAPYFTAEFTGPFTQDYFFQSNPLSPQGVLIVISTRTGVGSSYQLHIQKIAQFRPSDDLPDTLETTSPLMPGQSALVLKDNAIDRDCVSYRVSAGHVYRWSFAAYDPIQPASTSMGVTRDAQGRVMNGNSSSELLYAFEDGVWSIEIDEPPLLPMRITLNDLGVHPDDYGLSVPFAGQLTLDEVHTGTLDYEGDVDRWVLDVGRVMPNADYLITITDLDTNQFSSFTLLQDGDGNRFVDVSRANFASESNLPIHYTITVTTLIRGFSTYCPPDIGISGGRIATGRFIANTNVGDGTLDNNDFVAFISLYFSNDRRADFGSPGGIYASDGWLDHNDFIVYINLFFEGCQ